MYSFIVFSVTLVQLLIVGGAYLAQASSLFYNVAVYGSPFYSAMSLLRSDSALLDNNPLYIAMLTYHLIKYGLFCLAQTTDGRNGALTAAILFEAVYLCISAYYLN